MSVILATAEYDRKIRFWETPSGACSRTLRYPDSQVNCLEITPDKQFLAAGGNPHIRLFEIHTATTSPVLTLEGHTSNVTSMGFQRDGRYLYSGSEDGTCTLSLFVHEYFAVLFLLPFPCADNLTLFLLDARFLVLVQNKYCCCCHWWCGCVVLLLLLIGTVKLWDLRSPTYSRSFDCRAPVHSVALDPTNRAQIFSGDQNGTVRVWDLGSSRSHCINELTPDISSSKHQRVAIQAVHISEDGRTLIAANNHAHVFVWDPSLDPRSFRPITTFRAHAPGTYLLKAKLSPDGRHLVTTSSDRTAKLWDTSTWQLSQTLASSSPNSRWVWDAVFSADSSYLVTAASKTALLWNLRSGEVVRQYSDHHSSVTCVALNDSNP